MMKLSDDMEQLSGFKEIGSNAVWSVSSCKSGFGVEQLRDNSLETYWQSDGPQPHLINIQFLRRTLVSHVKLYADYKSDESYTPNKIAFRCGTSFHDLREVGVLELNEPTGWVMMRMEERGKKGQPISTFMIQIAIASNHQNGRDTHLRQVKVYSPIEDIPLPVGKMSQFTTTSFSQYSFLR
ncbi:unnamed protein product [Cyprideis torosa]|uniref:Anaphase-promoting complex subunit 10 n=1 Tax=Cyprideis torosa TaxID=163714 RepID=A0A7R8WWH2_9CRUS|nr:unnamed protein product [Cyprideis torosa]CAG0911583.1 unnamed protein product [Cyprideis torosa]